MAQNNSIGKSNDFQLSDEDILKPDVLKTSDKHLLKANDFLLQIQVKLPGGNNNKLIYIHIDLQENTFYLIFLF